MWGVLWSVLCISGVEEAPYLRVVVTRLQVVEAGFGIVIVATIPERVDSAQGACHGTCHRQDIAPCIVLVLHNGAAHGVDNSYHVTLEILDVRVFCSVVLRTGDTGFVVGEQNLHAFFA